MAGLAVRAAFRSSISLESSFTALLQELQHLWAEIGESEEEKDHIMLELEKDCMKVYQRKIHEARSSIARIRQSLVAKEAELASLMALLDEQGLQLKVEKTTSLKGKLASVNRLLEYLRGKKDDRAKQFSDIQSQIEKLNAEITGFRHQPDALITIFATEEQDLSLRKLAEYQTKLRSLQKEKSDRLHKVLQHLNEVHSLCGVLGMDFRKIIDEVHPSLHATCTKQSTNISDTTLERLSQCILKLRVEKKARIKKLQNATLSLIEMWNLMDSSEEEMKRFEKVTTLLGSPEDDVLYLGVLSLETIKQTEAEVERLKKLKISRTKELVLKKRSELEEICRNTHIEPEMSTAPEKACALLDSCLVDPSKILADIETQIIKAKEQSMLRKEIIDKVNKWLLACEEENWLEDYNKDGNKYNAGRGAHLNLKRAEKARVIINKIPATVDNLISKITTWEYDNNVPFLYDGVPLVSILEDYKLEKQQKEEEKQRFREHKKLQNLLLTEKEAMYGSKPTSRRSSSFRKTNSPVASGDGNGLTNPVRRVSVGGESPEPLSLRSSSARYSGYCKEARRFSAAPMNFVAVSKDDMASLFASESSSPLSQMKV
ncbi:65-kDa microtubule-associated protein 6 [Canna indica]|uniref:65-kDa microtubule-associated protein 6 n=1 Tax=Canna indica TaxID=4628 RepID=A0AAQ3KSJ9_9LILI|nr:65-kDa microtubule-associated protein 6 [Canna indica]